MVSLTDHWWPMITSVTMSMMITRMRPMSMSIVPLARSNDPGNGLTPYDWASLIGNVLCDTQWSLNSAIAWMYR